MLTQFGRISELVLAIFVVSITALLLIPLQPWLLDILLSVNLCSALLLLLVGLYTPNPLKLLAFPALLLLSTLFRLSLNVASTRLILSRGDAGQVIQTFGTFLISGEVVVGVILFLIITVVNFIVIARGASRVSEVSARFALDALPGKQMSIDADLRAGSISREEAERRRDELRKESQLFGSMDGAMKFVQGDVIAGIFIIFTNIIGGLYIGISSGLSVLDAIQRYTILTVGDGLVTQIPALLVSICAGIVVTRVSSGENATLGSDVSEQIFQRPGIMMFSGLLLALVGIVSSLPTLPFALVGFSFAITAYLLARRPITLPATQLEQLDYRPTVQASLGAIDVAEEDGMPLSTSELKVLLDEAVLYKIFESASERHERWWQLLRKDFRDATGLRLPDVEILPASGLAACSYSVTLNGVQIFSGRLVLDSVLIELHPASAGIYGLRVLTEERHPISGGVVFWTPQCAALQSIIRAAQLRTFDFMQFIELRVAAYFKRQPEELLSLSEVHGMLKQLERNYPGLQAEVLQPYFISMPQLGEVLQQLVRQGVAIKDFRAIVEAIASYCASHGITSDQPENVDIDEVVAAVRISRRRYLLAPLVSCRQRLRVCTLSPELEETLDQAEISDVRNLIAIDPVDFERARTALKEISGPIKNRGVLPFCVLCRSDLRPKVVSLLDACGELLSVVTYEELEANFPLESVGNWDI